jgi:hypothetical protein
MSVCNYVQLVTPNTCLGDSLATFNSNFSALDEGLCRQPDVVGKSGVYTELQISEQGHTTIDVSARNSVVYSTKFDFLSVATVEDIYFSDGTKISTTTVPYTSAQQNPTALIAFSTVALTRSAPAVSIYWTASGTNNATVYPTNEATASSLDIGTSKLNGSVTSLLSSGNYVYVGGDFTQVGEIDCRKLVILNLNEGTPHPLFPFTLGTAGSIVGSPLSGGGGFGLVGTINSIVEYGNLIIFGGTYQSLGMGRGLTIYDKTTGIVYPFYVNGDVNSLAVNNSELYIGGTFNYINYLAQSASEISGLRRYTNGLAKINLSLVVNFPNNSISTNFGINIAKTFSNLTTINAIAVKSNVTYIGGEFTAYSGPNLVASNLAIVNGDGTLSSTWNPFAVGEVITLAINGNYLYVGGSIRSFYSGPQFFAAPRKEDVSYNAICFDVTTANSPTFQYNWKPKFNGPVSKFAFHDQEYGSWVYCYGNFTQVNGVNNNYIAAVEKNYNNSRDGKTFILWKNNLEKPPSKINNALLRGSNYIVVGGSFQKINENTRPYLAKINGVYETLSTELLKNVNWQFGAQLCSPGTSLKMDTTNTVTVSSFAGTYGTVNETTFPMEYTATVFKNCTEGSLMRFFIKRAPASGSLQSSAHIIGWKVDFN